VLENIFKTTNPTTSDHPYELENRQEEDRKPDKTNEVFLLLMLQAQRNLMNLGKPQ
jgi:hypothetical protein